MRKMAKKIILIIDTSHSQATRVTLDIDGENYEKVFSSKVLKSQMVLSLLEELLSKTNILLTDIWEIQVNSGPGSFTGLRVGHVIAQLLSALLNVPVNGVPAGRLSPPVYGESKFAG